MNWMIIETKEETNETTYFEYETMEIAVENIKHMKIPELQEHLGNRTIRLFKIEEFGIDHIDGYSLEEASKRKGLE